MKRVRKLLISTLFATLLCGLLSAKEIRLNAGKNNLTAPSQSYTSSTSDVESYYKGISGIQGQSGEKLLTTLATSMASKHRYYTSYDDIKAANAYSDEDPNNTSNLICFYSSDSISNTWDGGSTWNREHVWCQSLSNGLYGTTGAGADIHQLKPTKSGLNSSRNNRAYAELNGKYSNVEKQLDKTNSNKFTGNYMLDGINTYNSNGLFEPKDEIKGDIARSLMYIYAHYSSDIACNVNLKDKNGNKISGDLDVKTIVYTPERTDKSSIELLIKWSKLDPVSEFESKRNNYCASITGVRNPFIDHPEFLSMIWDDSYNGSGALLDDGTSQNNDTFTLSTNQLKVAVGADTSIVVSDNKYVPTYKVVDPSIASITSSGIVTGLKVGETEIEVTVGNTTKKVALTVTSNIKYDVNFYYNDGTSKLYQSIKVSENDCIGEITSPTRDNYFFAGWTINQTNNYFDLATSPVTSNLNLYAKWSKNIGWYLVTSTNDLIDGATYAIVAGKFNKAMSKECSNANYNYRDSMDVTKEDSGLMNCSDTATSHLEKITLRAENASSHIYTFEVNNTNGSYLSIPGGSNSLKTISSKSNYTSLQVSIGSDSNHFATIKGTASDNNEYSIQYNSSYDRFSTYKTSQNQVCLYRLIENTDLGVNFTNTISYTCLSNSEGIIKTSDYKLNLYGSFTLADELDFNQKDLSNIKLQIVLDSNTIDLTTNATLSNGMVKMAYQIIVDEQSFETKHSYYFVATLIDTNKSYTSIVNEISFIDSLNKFIDNPSLLDGMDNKEELYNSLLFVKSKI